METIRVQGLHVQLQETVDDDERPCYIVQGLEVSVLGSAHRLHGVSVGIGDFAHQVRGVSVGLASIGNVRYGLFVTGLFGVDVKAAGLSVALFKNSIYRGSGVFVGGWNDADRMNGWMAGAVNGANRTYGLQTGLLNSSLDTQGVQIGIYNRSESLRGIQIGLLNVVTDRDGSLRRLPLVNVGW
jgi:hypothetical protein